MSFEQLGKKKQKAASSAPAQAKDASPKASQDKPPAQAPKTNLKDAKSFLHSDKKTDTMKDSKLMGPTKRETRIPKGKKMEEK